MSEYVERASLMGKLTAADMLQKLRQMSGEEVYSVLLWLVNDAPAADVAPVVHSYWEHIISSDEENIGVCHNCKYPVSWFWGIAKYCPACGARMDGGDNDG